MSKHTSKTKCIDRRRCIKEVVIEGTDFFFHLNITNREKSREKEGVTHSLEDERLLCPLSLIAYLSLPDTFPLPLVAPSVIIFFAIFTNNKKNSIKSKKKRNKKCVFDGSLRTTVVTTTTLQRERDRAVVHPCPICHLLLSKLPTVPSGEGKREREKKRNRRTEMELLGARRRWHLSDKTTRFISNGVVQLCKAQNNNGALT